MINEAYWSSLKELLEGAVRRRRDALAVEDEGGRRWTYGELDFAADRLATRLARHGVGVGDRVGLFLPKSLEAVGAIHGVLRAGAACVPVDPTSPAVRGAGVLADAAVKAVIASASCARGLHEYWPGPGPTPRLIVVDQDEQGPIEIESASWREVMEDDAPTPLPPVLELDDLAYILYTSGSTGKPKGVMLSNRNVLTFINWCLETLEIGGLERFSSHAPFHFDLSIFDLFVSCASGGTAVLIGESLGKDPVALSRFIDERRIDAWYSAPSILSLLVEHGDLARRVSNAPKLVLFAGEVFPIGQLQKLRTTWPESRMWNLYGPTETNVCTAFPIPTEIPADRSEPYPIGWVCEPLEAKVMDENGLEAEAGARGELWISGPSVMKGYFGRPDIDEQVFVTDECGKRWYKTGDLANDLGDGCFEFHGRRDRMVKKRGYRIELGEIESVLYRHQDVERAAVLAKSDEKGVAIAAFLSLKPLGKRSLIAIKRHCAQNLPPYMVPDSIEFLPELPTTSTDKVDYQRLKQMLTNARVSNKAAC